MGNFVDYLHIQISRLYYQLAVLLVPIHASQKLLINILKQYRIVLWNIREWIKMSEHRHHLHKLDCTIKFTVKRHTSSQHYIHIQ